MGNSSAPGQTAVRADQLAGASSPAAAARDRIDVACVTRVGSVLALIIGLTACGTAKGLPIPARTNPGTPPLEANVTNPVAIGTTGITVTITPSLTTTVSNAAPPVSASSSSNPSAQWLDLLGRGGDGSTNVVVPVLALACLVLVAAGVAIWSYRRRRGTPAGPRWSDRPPPAGTPYLEAVTSTGGRIYHPLPRPNMSIGREPGGVDVVLDDRFPDWKSVSRYHGEIEYDRASATVIVIDHQSVNGVYVDGQRTGECVLQDGARVSFGPDVHVIFRLNAV